MTDDRTTILVLDDDEGVRTQYRWLLSQYKVVTAGTRIEAVEVFERERPALAIVDLGLPPDPDGASEGLATVGALLQIGPEAKIIVVTGNENREHAVKAIASGAYDFFRKPVDPDLLGLIVERAVGVYELEQENRRLIATAPQSPIAGIVGSSPEMLRVLRDVERVAKTDIAVLLLGESGTGKELVAQAVHRLGVRASKPFVALNCAAIPESLLEAELFGHEKGAFTGAIKQTIGKIESANQGTLFLDEVGDIPLSMQVKLLRFLEDQVIERVGGRQQIKINVRILCATNQDLVKLIVGGRFREDLYYRINEIALHIPPLRERHGDAVVLANFFLKRYGAQFSRAFKGFTPDALAAIRQHPWRGNVRELENRVKRAAVMSEGPVVNAVDLDLVAPDTILSLDLRDARRRAEREAIEMALAQSEGNISKAAKLLGVSRPTLYDLVQEHGVAVKLRDLPRGESEEVRT
jgi:two-component system, NtrC family, response regulator